MAELYGENLFKIDKRGHQSLALGYCSKIFCTKSDLVCITKFKVFITGKDVSYQARTEIRKL